MAPNQGLPVLTALVLLPALGAVVVVVAGRAREALAPWVAVVFTAITFCLAIWVVAAADSVPAELYPWMPTLGVSLALESDGLSAILVAWAALATLLAAATTLPGARDAALALGLEAAVNGVFLSADVFLVLSSLGVAVVLAALMASVRRRVLAFAVTGMTLSFGWFVRSYALVDSQTGFASTDFARWESLVLYPNEERGLFVLGTLGVACLMLAFATAIDDAAAPHRLALLAGAGLVGSYIVVRLVVPLCPRGAEATSGWVLAVAVVVMVAAGLGRGWPSMALGYQGLVLFGLFSFREDAVAGAMLMMIAAAIGLFGMALTSSGRLAWYFVVFLVAMPLALVLVPAWRGDALWAVAGTIAFATMAYRLVRLVQTSTLDAAAGMNRFRLVSASVVVFLTASLAFGWSAWFAQVRPAAERFAPPVAMPDQEP